MTPFLPPSAPPQVLQHGPNPTSLTGSGICATCAMGRPMRARLRVLGGLRSKLLRELCNDELRELCREPPREPCPETTCRSGPRLSDFRRPLVTWAGAVAGFWGRGTSGAAWEKVTIFSSSWLSPVSSMLCRRLLSAHRSEGCLRMECRPSVDSREMRGLNSLEFFADCVAIQFVRQEGWGGGGWYKKESWFQFINVHFGKGWRVAKHPTTLLMVLLLLILRDLRAKNVLEFVV